MGGCGVKSCGGCRLVVVNLIDSSDGLVIEEKKVVVDAGC